MRHISPTHNIPPYLSRSVLISSYSLGVGLLSSFHRNHWDLYSPVHVAGPNVAGSRFRTWELRVGLCGSCLLFFMIFRSSRRKMLGHRSEIGFWRFLSHPSLFVDNALDLQATCIWRWKASLNKRRRVYSHFYSSYHFNNLQYRKYWLETEINRWAVFSSVGNSL